MSLADIAKGTRKQTELFGDHPQKIGKSFEDKIQRACMIYQVRGLAHIEKVPAPTIVIPKKGLIFTKKVTCDFIGCYKAGNQDYIDFLWKPIFIEAKSTLEGKISLGEEKTGLKAEQLRTLYWLSSRGIEAYVIWEIRKDNVIYKFTVSDLVDNNINKGSLSIMDCDEYHFKKIFVREFDGEGVVDFLNLLGE